MNKDTINKINKRDLCRGLYGLRKSRGLTLDELSFYTGKDIGYLSRLENMKSSPKFEIISDILSYYDMTVKEFYDKLDEFM